MVNVRLHDPCILCVLGVDLDRLLFWVAWSWRHEHSFPDAG